MALGNGSQLEFQPTNLYSITTDAFHTLRIVRLTQNPGKSHKSHLLKERISKNVWTCFQIASDKNPVEELSLNKNCLINTKVGTQVGKEKKRWENRKEKARWSTLKQNN